MPRLLKWITIPIAALAVWAIAMRWTGPNVRPIPHTLPHIVRNPPPSPGAYPIARNDIPLDEEVRRLHGQGWTGRHVGIAIIDRPLLTTHREFADRLRWYDEIDTEPEERAGWHSTAVASIAAGAHTGVAPEADLYVVGVGMIWTGEPLGNWFVAARRAVHTGQTLPIAIERVLEINTHLPPERRIRAIAIAIGGGGSQAIATARAHGIFVSTLDLQLPPFGPVTMASPAAPDAYTTHDGQTPSWAIARTAGLYALVAQKDPTMTPERFMREYAAGSARRPDFH